jgi:hypothetical protein
VSLVIQVEAHLGEILQHFGLSGLGDDDILDTDAMVANVPVETSDAIDRWLATKQRQVATTLQVRAAETVMKNFNS